MAKKRKNITAKRVRETDTPYVPKIDFKPEADDEDCGEDGLTVKQRLFVAALVGPARGNATKAAEMAGYRSDNRHALESTAYENLRKPEIQEGISLALARKKLSPEWIEATLGDLANADMRNFMSVSVDGQPQVDFKKAAAAGAIGQIKEFVADILPGGEGEEQKVIRCKIKLHDKHAAIATLAKMHGLLKEAEQTPEKDSIRIRAVKRSTEPTDADPGTD